MAHSSLPAVDNYSDTAQTFTFLRKGQPFYCMYNLIGILQNVAHGLERNPPISQGYWYPVEILGRFFQADVIEASAQTARNGQSSRFFFEKCAIQTSTESLTNVAIILMAVMNLGEIRIEGFGVDGPFWLRVGLDFLAINGDVGLFSSLALSLMSLKSGLGEAPQYVQAFDDEAQSESLANGDFDPERCVTMLRIAEVMSFSCSVVTLTFCTGKASMYVIVAFIIFAGSLAVSASDNWSIAKAFFKASCWPIIPSASIWPWEKHIKRSEGHRSIVFYGTRAALLCSLWAWILLCRLQNLEDNLQIISRLDELRAQPACMNSILLEAKLAILFGGFACSVLLGPLAYFVWAHREHSEYTPMKHLSKCPSE